MVVSRRHEKLWSQYDQRYNYVVQPQPLGTAHALLQTATQFENFDGNLLILYGDTPLFRASSIRGLLNRHRLRAAHPHAAHGSGKPRVVDLREAILGSRERSVPHPVMILST